MPLRNPQRLLFDRRNAAADGSHWLDGTTIDFLGKALALRLDTDRREPARVDGVLHLPLPPGATSRQVQDAAESWLRREAELLFTKLVDQEINRGTRIFHRGTPLVTLSFSLKGSWAKADDSLLRLNWRLIEQPLPVIELTLRRAVALLPAVTVAIDLFSSQS